MKHKEESAECWKEKLESEDEKILKLESKNYKQEANKKEYGKK